MKIGKGSRIGINTRVISPKNIILEDRVIVNEMCHLDGRGGIVIGHDSSISFGVTFITASHDMHHQFQYYTKNMEIGDHVWIGANAIVLDGAQIQKYAVIGAGCVFKGKANPYEVYVGNPAQMVKLRDKQSEYTMDFRPFFR